MKAFRHFAGAHIHRNARSEKNLLYQHHTHHPSFLLAQYLHSPGIFFGKGLPSSTVNACMSKAFHEQSFFGFVAISYLLQAVIDFIANRYQIGSARRERDLIALKFLGGMPKQGLTSLAPCLEGDKPEEAKNLKLPERPSRIFFSSSRCKWGAPMKHYWHLRANRHAVCDSLLALLTLNRKRKGARADI